MKIALTGGTGFVGRGVADYLAIGGHEVTTWLRPGTDRDRVSPAIDHVVPGQLGDADANDALCAGQDAVVHCAWFTPGDSFVRPPADVPQYYRANVLGSIELIEAARRAGVGRFVFVSSGAVHGKTLPGPINEEHPLWPTSIYGAAKAAVETAIHASAGDGDDAFCPATVRPTSIYGVDDPPSRSRYYDLVTDIAAGQDVHVSGGGKMLHIYDLAIAIGVVLQSEPADIRGQTFNCTGGWMSRRHVATTAVELLGSRSKVIGERPPSTGQTMRTDKIERLGMRFERDERLKQTLGELAATL